MRDQLRHEFGVFLIYFLIGLIAEIAGFIGWMNEMSKGGNVFQLGTAFWSHEISRLLVWFPVFVGLSAFRIFIFLLTGRTRERKSVGLS